MKLSVSDHAKVIGFLLIWFAAFLNTVCWTYAMMVGGADMQMAAQFTIDNSLKFSVVGVVVGLFVGIVSSLLTSLFGDTGYDFRGLPYASTNYILVVGGAHVGLTVLILLGKALMGVDVAVTRSGVISVVLPIVLWSVVLAPLALALVMKITGDDLDRSSNNLNG